MESIREFDIPLGILVCLRKKFIYTSYRYQYDLLMTDIQTLFAFRVPIFMFILMIPVLSMGINLYSEETLVYVSNGEDGDIAVMKLES